MVRELKPSQIYRRCAFKVADFETTDDLPPLDGIIGQERAVKALELGLGIRDRRYNIYVAGDVGTGKTSTVRAFLERVSANEPPPPDLCYVFNFEDPYFPAPLRLPAGEGERLRADMSRLIDGLKHSVPNAFHSREYQDRRHEVDESVVAERARAFEALEAEVGERGFALQRTPIGINLIPLREDGQPMTEDAYAQLSETERQRLEETQTQLQPQVQKVIREVTALEERRMEKLDRLNREVASFLIHPPVNRLREKHEGRQAVLDYLDAVENHLMANVAQFLPSDEEAGAAAQSAEGQDLFYKYQVNVLVDHSLTRGAPVIVQDNATYSNLFGRIEHRVQMGALTSDFTLVKPGSLHAANGGYLVLNGDNLMRNPASWEGLKVALKCGEIQMEDPDNGGLNVAGGLRPKPFPMEVKVIVVGGHELYQLLDQVDEDFGKFFNVKSEFSDQIRWEAGVERAFAQFVRARCAERDLLPFQRSGVARVVEYAAQLVGSQKRLSARFSDIMVIVREADYWARQAGDARVAGGHVERAIDQKHFRANLVEEVIREMLQDGDLLVDVAGAAVGQVNGLTVYELGDVSFGRPVRITAAAYAGKDGVVNIEREAELSGKIHTKGMLIHKAWLGETFAREWPLSLSASLTFEQSYSPVDGDSASCAELYALLSVLADVPLLQGIAVTGSMNQKGRVQPVGGVNQKVEGFFRVCKAKGLTGEQGAIIPAQNVDDLMLHRDVVEAVREGRFHLWGIKWVEEGLRVLTGRTVGRRDGRAFSPRSVYGRVEARLRGLSETVDSQEEDE